MEAPPGDGSLTLAIDVGSTAVKLLLLSPEGDWTISTHPTNIESPWPAVRTAVHPHAHRIERIGITGQGPSALLVQNGVRVGHLGTWQDPLTVEECVLGDGAILHPSGPWLPRRLKQWADSNPQREGLTSLQIKDWLNFELTGIPASDARSMRGLLDRDGTMPSHLQDWVGLGEIVPPLFDPATVIGRVTANGATLSGLSVGTEVICGCDDLSAGVLGLGPADGQVFNLANTSEHLGLIPLDCEGLVDHARSTGLSFLPACGRLPALLYAATSSGAATLLASGIQALPDRPDSLEGVPDFDPNLAGKRGLNPSASHVGGWALDPSECTSEQQTWRIVESLWDELTPILQQVRPFGSEAPILMGGGLAEVPAIVAARPVDRGAGNEVSALGVARLAQKRPHAVVFGAGKVGRGFLCQLLSRSGWEFSLVDAHRPTLDALSNGWTVVNLMNGESEILTSKTLHHIDDDLFELMDTADLVLTSMGANHLEAWAKRIREPLCQRLSDGKLDLILAENHPNPAQAVRLALCDGALADEAALIDTHLGISQAQVLRSCIEPTADQHPTTVQVQDHWTLPLDGDALLTEFTVEGFEPKANFERELTRKLFTYNCVNAMVCYIGHLKGYEWLADAANDPDIAALALRAGLESSEALVAAYGFDRADQIDWCHRALAKYQDASIRDPIERNARDPVRKLGPKERLVGPHNLCLEHDLPATALRIGIAAALRYPGAPSDIQSDIALENAMLDSLLAEEPL
jgi:mannitol-1-phosphate 5-dehydrogenase